jgi:hypothetical protein
MGKVAPGAGREGDGIRAVFLLTQPSVQENHRHFSCALRGLHRRQNFPAPSEKYSQLPSASVEYTLVRDPGFSPGEGSPVRTGRGLDAGVMRKLRPL